MKHWKERANLFANGKFGLSSGSDAYAFNIRLTPRVLSEWDFAIKDGDCQLIARPVSDMSDEEHEFHAETLNDNLIISEALGTDYLLSIGVYPFDQSHFESGEVIARYENRGGE